ncbi:ParA family protein [Staphylococcus cohnii]|uniref:ParA family protein n=1 Tax=Staphylococcus cohnii TaxID=29382 RepID=UPI00119D637D|nr:ParA family protein [Staphylococcus cohnii]
MKTITIANYKGGVGKSTLTEILSYLLATKYEKKVLVIDIDPQSDASKKLKRTFDKKIKPSRNIMDSILAMDLKPSIVSLHENLDLVHGDWDMEDFTEHVISEFDKNARTYLLLNLIKPLKNEYDYIIFDTRPSTDIATKNAICCSDYVLIATKTEESSAEGARKTYNYVGSLVEFNPKVKLLGVLPYLDKPNSSTSNRVKQEIIDQFQENVFNNIIKASDRVVTWGKFGITTDEPYDKKTLSMYINVIEEMFERIKIMEG